MKFRYQVGNGGFMLKCWLFPFLLLVCCNPAYSQSTQKEVDGFFTPQFSSTQNFTANTSCQRGVTGITLSQAGTVTRGTTTPLDSIGSECVLDATAASQTIDFTSGTFSRDTVGGSCEAAFVFEGDASAYNVRVLVGGSDVAGTTINLSSVSNPTLVRIPFACGAQASAKLLRFTSTSDGAAFGLAKVYLGTQPIVTPSPFFAEAVITGANPDLGILDVTSYAEITNGSLLMTPKTGSYPIAIMCSGTNAAATPTTSTSTCSAGDESVGFTVNIPHRGLYEVCMDYSHNIQADSSGALFAVFDIKATPTNAQTISLNGNVNKMNQFSPGTVGGLTDAKMASPISSCAYFSFSGSSSTIGFRLMYTQDVDGAVDSSILIGDNQSGSGGSRRIRVMMKYVGPQLF